MENFFKKRENEVTIKIDNLKKQLPRGYLIVPVTPTMEMLKASSLSVGEAQTEYYRMTGTYPPANK